MENKDIKYKLMVVENETDVFYCHNDKCNFHNIMIGCCGFEKGDKPKCDLCRKRTYTTKDDSGKLGDTSEVDI